MYNNVYTFVSIFQGKDDDTDSNASGGASTTTHQSEANALKRVSKKTHLEFHFCSLPGVVLPGQTLDFPIIFRSKKPGFFHESLYLLTHPQLKCTRDGRSYAVRLSGVCIDVELAVCNPFHVTITRTNFIKNQGTFIFW